MGVTEKTAILVISFGTSYEETRKKTIVAKNQISSKGDVLWKKFK